MKDTNVPYWVSAYHTVVFLGAGLLAVSAYLDWWNHIDSLSLLKTLMLSLSLGAMGGNLQASRWVIWVTRHGNYDIRRLLWQIMTPVHSAILSVAALLLVRSGILTLTVNSELAEPNYSFFVMAFSFFVGFASEIVVKRIMWAVDRLFGEKSQELGKGASKKREDESE